MPKIDLTLVDMKAKRQVWKATLLWDVGREIEVYGESVSQVLGKVERMVRLFEQEDHDGR